ncbi:Asd/ArgC dimerization domain-containing protein [Celerinatantimonas sp. YJH-8]|uniref:Asd/ArgC dimerization domain-containing protein n=1 Tax=Celerinatantimonas sp. YJH-8 TaxID=3228714 RepID=UPI0038C003C9
MAIAVLGASSLLGKSLIEQLVKNSTLADLVLALDTLQDDAENQLTIAERSFDIESPEGVSWSDCQVIVGCSAELVATYADDIIAAGGVLLNATDSEVIGAVSSLSLSDSEWMGAQGVYQLPCATVLMLRDLLKRIDAEIGISAVHVSALLSVSTEGQLGIDELAGQTARLLNGLPVEPEVYSRQIAFNLLAQSPAATSVAEQVEQQLPLIFAESTPLISAHSVSVPVFYGEMALVSIESTGYLSIADFIDIAGEMESVDVELEHPVTLVTDLNQHPRISVSQIRQSPNRDTELKCCIQADVLRACKVPYLLQLIQLISSF